MPSRLLLFALAALAALPAAAQSLWREVPPDGAAGAAEGRPAPAALRAFALDRGAMDARLAQAPREATPGAMEGAVAVPLPLANGTVADFLLVEAPVMAPGLQDRFPALRAYVGHRADRPAVTARVTATPRGIGAWIMAPEGVTVVDPAPGASGAGAASGAVHVAYRRADARPPEGWAEARAAEVFGGAAAAREAASGEAHDHEAHDHEAGARGQRAGHGETLRLYRIAIGATGEYTEFHGGTVEAAMEAIVVAMARVNGLYERDVAVRMLLVDGNERVVFTDALFDPYTDGDPFELIEENIAVLNDAIGVENYDIGHVFSTGGGGLAGFGVVCRDDRKAEGVTGLPSPVGDPFYVDYVAHEIGHQFRAAHTFNGTAGFCGGNRSPGTSVEPGSGSTIMGYAGICAGHNIQTSSDAYFHAASLRQIRAYVTTDRGRTCGESESTGNEPPVVTVPGPLAVPYAWEEVTVGSGGAPPGAAGFTGGPPLFRSFAPAPQPVRTFPQPDRLIAGLRPVVGEGLPQSGAVLRFRLTARDNRPGVGGVGFGEVEVTADAGAGPFRVTEPNAGGLEFSPGAPLAITWSVAGTASLSPEGEEDPDAVDVDTVDLLFSADNGATFTPLLLGTPNDGAETVMLPPVETPEARVIVRAPLDALGSVFFDANDAPFALVGPVSAEAGAEASGVRLGTPRPHPVGAAGAWLDVEATAPEAVDLALFNALGRRVRTLYRGPLAAGVPVSVRVEAAGLAPGVYVARLASGGGVASRRLTVTR